MKSGRGWKKKKEWQMLTWPLNILCVIHAAHPAILHMHAVEFHRAHTQTTHPLCLTRIKRPMINIIPLKRQRPYHVRCCRRRQLPATAFIHIGCTPMSKMPKKTHQICCHRQQQLQCSSFPDNVKSANARQLEFTIENLFRKNWKYSKRAKKKFKCETK